MLLLASSEATKDNENDFDFPQPTGYDLTEDEDQRDSWEICKDRYDEIC